MKKADVLKILKDYDREGKGKITFQDFNEISKNYFTCWTKIIVHKLNYSTTSSIFIKQELVHLLCQ